MNLTEARKRLGKLRDKTRPYLAEQIVLPFDGKPHLCSTDGKALVAIEVPASTPLGTMPERWAKVVKILEKKPGKTTKLSTAAIRAAIAESHDSWIDDEKRDPARFIELLGSTFNGRLLIEVLEAAGAEELEGTEPRDPEKLRALFGLGWRAAVMPVRLSWNDSMRHFPTVKLAEPAGAAK